jgi:hypothetical protein
LLAAEQVYERASALRRSGPCGECSAAVSVHADFRTGGGTLFGGLPARYALQDQIGVLRWGDVTIVVFNHADGCAHLLGQEVHVNTFHESERGVGVAQAIG